MTDFQVTLRVSASRLATVLEALTGAAVLVSVLPCEGEEKSKALPKRQHRFANGKRDKGVSGQALALAAFKRTNGSLTTGQLARIFEAQGFSPNSNSPAIAALAARGLVERVEMGRWKITEAGKKEEVA